MNYQVMMLVKSKLLLYIPHHRVMMLYGNKRNF